MTSIKLGPPKLRLLLLSKARSSRNNLVLKMGCRINSHNPPVLCQLSARKPSFSIETVALSSNSQSQTPLSTTTLPKTDVYTVNFKTQGACKLGIARYPDFGYNAQGGTGTGSGRKIKDGDLIDEISVSFDLETLYIPPLTSETTKFLGLPLPPFLKIDVVPELFQGSIKPDSGKVNFEFTAKFLFSVGSIYRPPPLLVKTVLTTEESNGKIRSGRGDRLDAEGKCRLVGVATVDPINDAFMNTFLGLPTECLADLNAVISFSGSS